MEDIVLSEYDWIAKHFPMLLFWPTPKFQPTLPMPKFYGPTPPTPKFQPTPATSPTPKFYGHTIPTPLTKKSDPRIYATTPPTPPTPPKNPLHPHSLADSDKTGVLNFYFFIMNHSVYICMGRKVGCAPKCVAA